jgi:hypothetical protein
MSESEYPFRLVGGTDANEAEHDCRDAEEP